MYQHDGYDKSGLSRWIRTTGTKGENFHAKLRRGTGPFGVGVEAAHYKHVLISFSYGVNAGVRRRGMVSLYRSTCYSGYCDSFELTCVFPLQPDLGHWRLDIEDLIQNKIRQIWNVTVFPHRDNMSEFDAIEGFVAAGLGPLSHNPRFVTKSDTPHRKLKGGLKFMAQRMKVELPPLPIQGKLEYSLLRENLKVTPTPNKQQLESWCEQYKVKADGINVFPKLPNLLRAGAKQYQVGQKIRLLGLHTEEGFNKLLGELRTDVVLENPQQQERKLLQLHEPSSRHQSVSEQAAPAVSIGTSQSILQDSSSPQSQMADNAETTQAPAQATTTTLAVEDRCKWWPICKSNKSQCGGSRKSDCNVYGNRGSYRQSKPTDYELARAIRHETWTNKRKSRDCAFHPICKQKAVDCGGWFQTGCCDYGKNGTMAPPGEIDLSLAKKAAKSKKQNERNKAKRQQNSTK